jgi:hypothetical protein
VVLVQFRQDDAIKRCKVEVPKRLADICDDEQRPFKRDAMLIDFPITRTILDRSRNLRVGEHDDKINLLCLLDICDGKILARATLMVMT